MWVFGVQAGLDFNVTPPKSFESITSFPPPFPAPQTPPYYISSICDVNGNLLFYTDGIKVWKKNGKEIEKNLGRWPWSGFMMPLIFPCPGRDSLYYLFGVSDHSYANSLQCVTIRATTGSDAEIVYPEPSTINNYFTRLLDGASLVVAGTHACNGEDVWIAGEAKGSLYSFLVTNKGIDTIPVVSSFLNVLPQEYIKTSYSNMKFSASGEKMILPSVADHALFVFDFDNQTGKFSNPVKLTIPETEEFEDAELSPDGTKLYYASETQSANPEIPGYFHDVYQFDLNAGNVSAILATKIKLSYSEHEACSPRVCVFVYKTLQLGPDEKIYISQRTSDVDYDQTATVIEFPNKTGSDCFYKYNGLDLKLKFSIISYNYIRSFTYTSEKNGIQTQKSNCKDKPVEFSLLYKNVDSVKWNFGDQASGNNNFSFSLRPQHTYPGVGNYTITAIIYKQCKADTVATTVMVDDIASVHISDNIKDTVICKGQDFTYDATTANATGYLWSTGLIYPTRKMTEPGTYSITAYNECSADKKTFNVAIDECNCNVFVPTAFTPNKDGLNDKFRPVLNCSAQKYNFFIYNRFGQIEFKSSTIGEGWNGYFKAYPAPNGTYIWKLSYVNPNNKKIYNQSGTVILLR